MNENKIVFLSSVARHLLKLGNTIVDIKPDKTNKERTVFVFRNDEKFKHDLAEVLKEQRESKKATDQESR